MAKRILFLLMLAFTCMFILAGCGGSDGSDGKDADTSAIIAELQAQLESGQITIQQYEDAIAALQAQANSGKVAQVESCSVCHNDVAEIHKQEASIVISSVSATDNGDGTASLDFSLSYDGSPVTDITTGTVLATRYVYYNDATQNTAITGTATTKRGFRRYNTGITATVTNNGGGSYSVAFAGLNTIPDFTAGTTPARLFISGSSTTAGGFTLTGDTNGGVQGVYIDSTGCERCHTSVFESSHHGAYSPQGDQCLVCHSRYDGGTDSEAGHRLTRYVHGIHNSENMTDGIFVRSYTTDTNGNRVPVTTTPDGDDTFAVGFPTKMSDCEVCHTTQVADVTDNSQMNLTLCKSCHRGSKDPWLTTDAGYADAIAEVWAAIPMPNDAIRSIHTNMTEATTCVSGSCHGSAGKDLADIHSGKSKARELGKNIYYFTPETSVANGVLTVTWGAFEDANGNGTYDSGTDTMLDVTNATDTTKPVFMQTYSERVVDGVIQSDGVRILVGYYGHGTKDVANYEGFTKTNFTTTDATASGYTTVNSDGKAVTKIKLSSTIMTQYDATEGIVGIIGIPWVDGENAIVKSVAKEFTLADGADLASPRTAVASDSKCDQCHNTIAIHMEEDASSGHGHTAIGAVDVCRICHVPSAAAGHYPQQSRSIDSYVHAIHEGEPTFASYGSEAIEYPKSTADCEACHDAGTYEVPDQTKSLGGVISGSEGANTTADQFVTGPAAVACGGCHRAYPVITGNSSDLASFNAHTKTFGYRAALSDMPYVDVLDVVFSLF
ncbi:MAG: hypothetical protein AB7F25_07145 [Deferribacterales bacterium]